MTASRVSRSQRFTRDNPCPVCLGDDSLRRHQGERCYGYLGDDGRIYCTRQEFAGALQPNANGDYAHPATGSCPCGGEHAADGQPLAPRKKHQAPTPQRGPFPAIYAGAKLAATYDYPNTPTRTHSVLRYEYPLASSQVKPDKTFPQARWIDADTWVMELGETERTLFHQPELRAAPPKRPVFLVEGEECVLALERFGFVATTSSGGAGKWELTPGRCDALAGRTVYLLSDNDTAGAIDSAQKAADLIGVVASMRILTLPDLPEHGDICDWIASGGDVKTLCELAMTAPVYTVPSAQSEKNSSAHHLENAPDPVIEERTYRHWEREARANPAISPQNYRIMTALYTRFDRTWRAAPKLEPVFLPELAAECSVTPQTVSEQLRDLSERGVIVRHVERTIGPDGMPRAHVSVAPAELWTTPAQVSKPETPGKQWGGKRPGAGRKCKECGSENLRRRTSILCRDCGTVEALPDEDLAPAEDPPHDAPVSSLPVMRHDDLAPVGVADVVESDADLAEWANNSRRRAGENIRPNAKQEAIDNEEEEVIPAPHEHIYKRQNRGAYVGICDCGAIEPEREGGRGYA